MGMPPAKKRRFFSLRPLGVPLQPCQPFQDPLDSTWIDAIFARDGRIWSPVDYPSTGKAGKSERSSSTDAMTVPFLTSSSTDTRGFNSVPLFCAGRAARRWPLSGVWAQSHRIGRWVAHPAVAGLGRARETQDMEPRETATRCRPTQLNGPKPSGVRVPRFQSSTRRGL